MQSCSAIAIPLLLALGAPCSSRGQRQLSAPEKVLDTSSARSSENRLTLPVDFR